MNYSKMLTLCLISAAAAWGSAMAGGPPIKTTGLAGRGLPSSQTTVYSLDGERTNALSTTHSYDAQGNLVEVARLRDDDADGVPETVESTETYGYDGRRNLVEGSYLYVANANWDGLLAEFTIDYVADGIVETILTTELRYDEHGNVVEQIDARDSDPDGVVDTFDKLTRNFDRQGNLLEEIQLSGIRTTGDALPSRTDTSSFVYETRRNLLNETRLRSYRSAGIPSYGTTITYTY